LILKILNFVVCVSCQLSVVVAQLCAQSDYLFMLYHPEKSTLFPYTTLFRSLVIDLTETTRANIAQHQPDSADAVRALPLLAAFSPQVRTQATDLKRFLHANLYRHYRVARMGQKAQRILRELFESFIHDPQLLAP